MNTLFSNTKRVKKCSHKIITEKLLLISSAYFYCYKCGKLIIVKNLKMYESITEGKLEYNPIKVINQMILNQEKNINSKKKYISDIYIKNRDLFIYYIKQFCRIINNSKSNFFNCLHLMDSYLIHELKEQITKRNIILITLEFFLVSLKFNEIDLYEPKLNKFCKIDKDIVVSENEIRNYEIKCLKIIDYNIINYSAYDWLKTLNKVGYAFNNRINKLKFEQIKDKQKLILRRIIYSDILYRYDSFIIALSIIHLSMDNTFYTDKTSKELFDLFLTIFSKKFSDYEDCYKDIKIFILNDFSQTKNEDEKNSINLNERNGREKESDKLISKKLIHLLKSMMNKDKNKSKIIDYNKLSNKYNTLRKIVQRDEYSKRSNIERYISKVKKINKKQYSKNISKDLFSIPLLNNIDSQKHLTIDCTNNKIESINISNIPQNSVLSNSIQNNNSNIISKKHLIKDKNINHLLKKSKTSLSQSPNNCFKENKNMLNAKNDLEPIKKNKNITQKVEIRLKKENKCNNIINMSGRLKLICRKSQIKNFILKKDGFINWKQEKNNLELKNKNNRNKNYEEDKKLFSLKKNKTNIILPKFIMNGIKNDNTKLQ